jgi:hypothetical protein
MMAIDFPEYPGNYVLVAVIAFSETKRNHRGLNQASKEAGGPLQYFFSTKICPPEKVVCTGKLS